MAIKSNMAINTPQGEVIVENIHCVLTRFTESFKGHVNIMVSIWYSKQHYLQGLPEMTAKIFNIQVSQLPLGDTMRASVYLYLMQQPEFISPVADMDDDFPVTPIE